MQKTNKELYSITGNFVTVKAGQIWHDYGTLYIKDGLIYAIETNDTPLTEEMAPVRDQCSLSVRLPDDDIIYPGLIDLHSHYQYNMFPIWKRPQKTAWDNRFEWRRHHAYHEAIPALEKKVRENWDRMLPSGKNIMGDFLLFLSELQAVAGGTTVLQAPSAMSREQPSMPYCYSFAKDARSHLLIRSTGNASDLGISAGADDEILSIIDFFTPGPIEKTVNVTPHISTKDWQTQDDAKYLDFLSRLRKAPENDTAYLVHVAEGRCGNLRPDGLDMDAYTSKEFEQLKSDMEKLLAESGNKLPENLHLGIIHGCGIDLTRKEHYDFLKSSGIGLIWSPVSNLLLYDDTPAFYENITDGEITLSIGSDWSPSGSKYVWDEAKFAYKYLESRNPSMHIMSDVFKMMTTNPARILGSDKIGCIRPGAFADFFILGRPKLNYAGGYLQRNASESCLTPLFRGTDAQTRLVIVGGQAVYGDESYFRQFHIPYQKLPSDENNIFHKAVYVPKELEIDLERDIEALDRILAENKMIRSKFLIADDPEYREQIVALRRKFIGELTLDILPASDNALRLRAKSAFIHNETGREVRKGDNLSDCFLASRDLRIKKATAESANTLLLTFDSIPGAGDSVLLREGKLRTVTEKSNPYDLVFAFSDAWSEW